MTARLPPGKKRPPGRPKGTPNKITKALKDAIEHAFIRVGGEAYLVRVAESDPKTFCALLAKLLPSELAVGDGNELRIRIVE